MGLELKEYLVNTLIALTLIVITIIFVVTTMMPKTNEAIEANCKRIGWIPPTLEGK